MIYEYTCDTCQVSYIGSSINQSRFQFFQHLWYSCRIKSLLATPVKYSIREHFYDNDHPIKLSNFSMVTSIKNVSELRILESMYIKNQNPNLNKDFSFAPLYVLYFFFVRLYLCNIYPVNMQSVCRVVCRGSMYMQTMTLYKFVFVKYIYFLFINFVLYWFR